MKQLIFLGAPGSGKGTQASRVVEAFGYKHVSTGDLLRAEIAKGSELGQRVDTILKEGKLVDNETVLELLKANCDLGSKSYIFDGYPRNLDQSKSLDQAVLGDSSSVAIYFDMDLEGIIQRIVNRRIAKGSGEIYNLLTRAPKVAGKCDVSGEDLVHRADDQEDVVRKRMDVFKAEIEPMLSYYSEKGNLLKIDASKSADAVYSQLADIIKN